MTRKLDDGEIQKKNSLKQDHEDKEKKVDQTKGSKNEKIS